MMIVQNNEIFQNEIDAVLARMKEGPFRAAQLARAAKAEIAKNPRTFQASRSNRGLEFRKDFQEMMLNDIGVRLADALIQKARKAGQIKEIGGWLNWTWVG